MPTPKQGYYTKSGKRVTSVTTIIGRFKQADALINWAWQLGRDGLDYRTVRDDAGDTGTLAHAMIERWLHGQPIDDLDGPVEIFARAKNAYENFLRWADESKPDVIETEVQLVSEEHLFGGTFDAILRINETLVLADWKTSKRVYPDHLVQLAAYGLLWRENRNTPLDGFALMRFDKESDEFEEHRYSELYAEENHFLNLRAAYDSAALVEKRKAAA